MAWKGAWLFSGAVVLAAAACSSDDHELGGNGGSSGSGGSGAGTAGNAGRGGSQSGTGGSTTGGGAGTAGSGGKGGSGTGGSGDAGSTTGGGAGDATSGGSAGASEADAGGTGEGGSGAGGMASVCEREGGSVVELPCPPGRHDFANFCNVGLCTSAPETLTDSILECQCPNGCWDGEHCITDEARRCLESGGKLTTSLCCASVDAFPNTCAVGACGCSPDNSHEVPSCDCPEGGCFDGTRCR